MSNKSWSESKLAPWNWNKHEEQTPALTEDKDSHPIARFHRDIDRLFADTFRALNVPDLLDHGAKNESIWGGSAILRPSLDIKEHTDSYELSVELPGVNKDDLKLNLEGNLLTISGEKKNESKSDEKGKYHRVERSYGSFSRTLTLPEDIDSKDIKAAFNEGILNIEIKRVKGKESPNSEIPIT
ncbi:heat-shock protein Hsp20 [Aliidiomarina minuta]|uniref:Heat-shock protein Hsp20 n=1 Tax=Aliidiomarina minuta TaxID=880057 RepID=A0A432W4R3_9GAMM|nr:Hsp20/alpha crystallin family protein [Aliidiomarina minuta]RUO24424.1 heat-shock protein Hsp20 [Aliidiomarina minuta]